MNTYVTVNECYSGIITHSRWIFLEYIQEFHPLFLTHYKINFICDLIHSWKLDQTMDVTTAKHLQKEEGHNLGKGNKTGTEPEVIAAQYRPGHRMCYGKLPDLWELISRSVPATKMEQAHSRQLRATPSIWSILTIYLESSSDRSLRDREIYFSREASSANSWFSGGPCLTSTGTGIQCTAQKMKTKQIYKKQLVYKKKN